MRRPPHFILQFRLDEAFPVPAAGNRAHLTACFGVACPGREQRKPFQQVGANTFALKPILDCKRHLGGLVVTINVRARSNDDVMVTISSGNNKGELRTRIGRIAKRLDEFRCWFGKGKESLLDSPLG